MGARSELDGVDAEIVSIFCEELGEVVDALRRAREPKQVHALLEQCAASSTILGVTSLARSAERAAAIVRSTAITREAVDAVRRFSYDVLDVARDGGHEIPGGPVELVVVAAVAKPWWRFW